MLTLADIWEGVTRQSWEALRQVGISEVVIDSRQVRPHSLFVALKGEQQDGHVFIGDALSRGAIAVLAEDRVRGYGITATFLDTRTPLSPTPAPPTPICLIVDDSLRAFQDAAAFWRRQFDVQTIGVTGSIGKTTTKELSAAVLRQRFRTFKSEGNLNSETGLPLALLHLDASYQRAVLEMGMYALGEIRRLAEIALPKIGIVTNVGPSHLERLGTLERIAQAKAELVESLPADGTAILNGDDPIVRAMAKKTRARLFCYGLDPTCDLWASDIEGLGLEGVRFRMHHAGETPLHVRVPLLGRHSVHTALAAASVGLAEGLTWSEIIAGLQDISAQLRLIATPGFNASTLLDDTYNSSPASAIAALNLLGELEGRRIAVLGDMLELGSFEQEGHHKVGGRAAEVAHLLVAVGPRGRLIGEAARAGGLPAEAILFAKDNAEAIAVLRPLLKEGDVVLIKGSRGMKMEEIVVALATPTPEPANRRGG